MFGWLLGSRKSDTAKKGGQGLGSIVAQATQFLTQSLREQMAEMDGIEHGIPAAAKDVFSLGYIAGFTEAVATMRQIDSDTHAFVVHQAVFADLFGPQEGSLLFARFMKTQEEGNDELSMGMTIGGEDLFGWLNGDVEAPRRWLEYVNKN